MYSRIKHLLNSFSHVQVYLFCFALPQAILSSLILENNSLIPLDQSGDVSVLALFILCPCGLELAASAATVPPAFKSLGQPYPEGHSASLLIMRKSKGSAPLTILLSMKCLDKIC